MLPYTIMAQKRIGNSKGDERPGGEPEDEKMLWDTVTKDVTPLKTRKTGGKIPKATTKTPAVKAQNNRTKSKVLVTEHRLKPIENTKKAHASSTQMSAQQKRRHQGGDLPIEGKIDLHGKTLDTAFRLLKSFIVKSYTAQKRNLLVITGKGRTRSDGMTIRQSFPRWVQIDADMSAFILSVSPAQPKDGGDGAWYVLLRRQRSGSERGH